MLSITLEFMQTECMYLLLALPLVLVNDQVRDCTKQNTKDDDDVNDDNIWTYHDLQFQIHPVNL